MSRSGWAARLPALLVFAGAVGLWIHGPIPQFADYHDFADRRALWGIPNAADVLSNAAFAAAGALALWRLAGAPPAPSRPGHALFAAALLLTCAGSSYYHVAPDDARLVFDRVPIALACAGLLAAVHAETRPARPRGARTAALAALAAAAVGSVLWWRRTGDLRPYLLLQTLPLLLIPLWQALGRAPRATRAAYGAAIGLYVLARAAELADRAVFSALGQVSGHTLKHLLAAAAAGLIVSRMATSGGPGAEST